nr:hypothetical protein P5630_05910 [Bacillus subtilis]
MVKDSEFLTLVFQSILDEIDIVLHVVDEHGNTIVYNNKMMQIEDMEKHDVLNKNLMDVFMFSKRKRTAHWYRLFRKARRLKTSNRAISIIKVPGNYDDQSYISHRPRRQNQRRR